jgi:uroporphyrinogen decarboxylase
MTSRERILCAFDKGVPDRVPVSPYGFGHINPDSEIGLELVARTDFIADAGYAGASFVGTAVDADSRHEGDSTITEIRTPKGDLRSVHRRTAITSAQVEFPCKTADDIEKLLSVPYTPDKPNPTAFNQWKDRIGDDGIVLCGLGDAICVPAQYFSPIDFSLLWADAPDAMIELCKIANERLCESVETALRAGIDAFRFLGGEYASTQLGPSAYQALVTDLDRQVTDIMHEHGAVVYYHNHGPTMRYLELLAGVGMDACDCFEAPPWGDCDLVEAKRRIGDRICFVGNLDDMENLDKMDTETIQRMGRERIAQAGPGGFVLGGTASGTYGERAARNFIALVDVAQEMAVA